MIKLRWLVVGTRPDGLHEKIKTKTFLACVFLTLNSEARQLFQFFLILCNICTMRKLALHHRAGQHSKVKGNKAFALVKTVVSLEVFDFSSRWRD